MGIEISYFHVMVVSRDVETQMNRSSTNSLNCEPMINNDRVATIVMTSTALETIHSPHTRTQPSPFYMICNTNMLVVNTVQTHQIG